MKMAQSQKTNTSKKSCNNSRCCKKIHIIRIKSKSFVINICNTSVVWISDKDYESMGATFTSSDEIISNSNAITNDYFK